jgi:hypothetical protein
MQNLTIPYSPCSLLPAPWLYIYGGVYIEIDFGRIEPGSREQGAGSREQGE